MEIGIDLGFRLGFVYGFQFLDLGWCELGIRDAAFGDGGKYDRGLERFGGFAIVLFGSRLREPSGIPGGWLGRRFGIGWAGLRGWIGRDRGRVGR